MSLKKSNMLVYIVAVVMGIVFGYAFGQFLSIGLNDQVAKLAVSYGLPAYCVAVGILMAWRSIKDWELGITK
jgi:hypothetical protein